MIQFAHPLALASLLAIPIIVLLYLLRPRRRRVVLSTTALWQAALKERERGLGFERLLRDLSLLLLVAAALVLGLALADPQWVTRSKEPGDIVLVLDVSASMKARSGLGSTRFDQARAQAAEILNDLPRDARMLVITSGRKAVIRSGFESDRDGLRRVLAEIRPGDEAGRPREALALAQSLLRNREQGRIYFITDGAFDPEVDPRSPQVVFRIVGAPARNVALTRFDLRQETANDDRFEVMMALHNYTDRRVVAPASVTLEGRRLFSEPIELAAGEARTLTLPFGGRAAGRAVARIDVDDDLAADNQAFAVASADSPRVLLYTSGNFYLESVLRALPGVELVTRKWTPDEDLTRLAQAHDIVVFDGIAPPALPAGQFLLVNSVAAGLPFSESGWVAQPAIRGSGESALMRDVDISALRIDRARRVVIDERTPGLQRLFWSAETPLALALLDESRKLVYLGFDLRQSNFPRQAVFPLFIGRSVEWLRAREAGWTPTHVAAGSSYPITPPAGAVQVIVHKPSGATETLPVERASVLFDATTEAGLYRYAGGDRTRDFAVSLVDDRESDINRRWVPGDRTEARGLDNAAQAVLPLWPHLLALALLLLILEWGLWSRRSHA